MEFVVTSDNLPELAKFRTRLKTAFSTQYIGWDEDYDSQFDSHTVWFGLKRNEKYVATCKLIFKWKNGHRINLPLECGDLKAFSASDDENVCEGSGVTLMGTRYIFTLIYQISDWMVQNKTGRVYSIVDIRNERLQDIYKAVGFEFLPDQFVSFSDFCYKADGKPVIWQAICLTPERFHSKEYYTNLEQLGAMPLFQRRDERL